MHLNTNIIQINAKAKLNYKSITNIIVLRLKLTLKWKLQANSKYE